MSDWDGLSISRAGSGSAEADPPVMRSKERFACAHPEEQSQADQCADQNEKHPVLNGASAALEIGTRYLGLTLP